LRSSAWSSLGNLSTWSFDDVLVLDAEVEPWVVQELGRIIEERGAVRQPLEPHQPVVALSKEALKEPWLGVLRAGLGDEEPEDALEMGGEEPGVERGEGVGPGLKNEHASLVVSAPEGVEHVVAEDGERALAAGVPIAPVLGLRQAGESQQAPA
jgi:hypothetical protein